jgi:hypothetical protein
VRRAIIAGVAALLGVSVATACDPIESRRRSTAPLNASDDFACDRYGDKPVRAVPRGGRCIVDTSITYDFTVVVHVPESSFYAAAHTFVLTSSTTASLNDLEVAGTSGQRRAKLPVIGTVTGAYTVKEVLSRRVFFPDYLLDGTSIPVRAIYVPLGRVSGPDYDPALPLDVVFATSRVDDNQSPRLAYVRSLPAGRWLRAFEPEPPWDEVLPPFVGTVEVKRIGDQLDIVDLGGANGDYDDLGGNSRDARITRAEGLEDWTVFLRDLRTGRRISTVKTLCTKNAPCNDPKTEATARLDTVGRGVSLDDVEAVLAPPAKWIGVPTLVENQFLGAAGIPLPYPDLRPPVALEGIVAASADAGVFLAVASRVTLESESITLPSGSPQPLLRYSANVSTDDRGRFATVVPPGTYRVTVEPFEGSEFASFRTQVVIEDGTAITLSPPRRTRVRGVALLSDGRPAANAEVVAVAEPLEDTSSQPPPRPARTTVRDDGSFTFDLDQGAYVLTVVPEEGTGFPRVVARATIPANEADVGIVRIPPPTVLALQIVDPTTLARPIPLANVRIFARPEGGGPLLEIGSGMTNATGRVEILLAQQPK